MHQNLRIKHTSKHKLLDKYYTKTATVARCLRALDDMRPVRYYDHVIDPSAGAGAFYHAIAHNRKLGMDIDPEHKAIQQQDWLEYQIKPDFQSVLVIGNPPFGQYHRLSTAFIRHALSFDNVKTIGFILPNVYKKHTRQRVLPRNGEVFQSNWRIASITDLDEYSFTLNNKDYHIPSAFFVFDKSNGIDLRVDAHKYPDSKHFSFGRKNDFDIFVFGASPKHITKHPKSNNRGYYLKSKVDTNILINNIKKLDWTGNSCASGGVFWLTKHEFLEQYISHYA